MARPPRSLFLALCVLSLMLPACSSDSSSSAGSREVVFAVATEPSSWRTQPQQHATLAQRFADLLNRAEPIDSMTSFVQSLSLSQGTALFIGESIASPSVASELAAAILARKDASGITLWEEGEQWQLTPEVRRVQGLLTGVWDGNALQTASILPSGFAFNKAFADRCTSSGLPDRLLVYTANAHVYFDPELPNPFPPNDWAPLPPNAARRSRAASVDPAAAGSGVLSIQTYSSKAFLDRVDLLLAQCIAVEMNAGTLSPIDAIAAVNWSVSRVTELRESCKGIGHWTSRQSPDCLLLVIEDSETRDGISALSSLGNILTRPTLSSLVLQGWTPILVAARYPVGLKQGRDASFEFRLRAPPGQRFDSIPLVIGRNGPGYTENELE